jgi:hypothetical protein
LNHIYLILVLTQAVDSWNSWVRKSLPVKRQPNVYHLRDKVK